MMISAVQKKQLQQLFDTLPQNVKAHSIRTGIGLQVLVSRICADTPEYISDNQKALCTADAVMCAREFGFYHHIGDSSSKNTRYSSPREMISSIFDGAWNVNGFYAHGLLDTIETHDEHWDGSGLPNGLRGIQIPFWGRVCAVAEVYDNICSAPNAPSPSKAMKQLKALSGTVLDPELTAVFAECSGELRSLYC